jgi:hypothetical protein
MVAPLPCKAGTLVRGADGQEKVAAPLLQRSIV